jgi:hypothetical protein
MNRLSTQGLPTQTREAKKHFGASSSMMQLHDVDPRERALAHRLEMTKQRLVADLGKLSTMFETGAEQVGARFVRMGLIAGGFVVGGLLLLGIVTAVVRRRRRFRVRFL